MSGLPELNLAAVESSRGSGWESAMALYREAFSAAEREPEARLARGLDTGRYRLVVARGAPGARRGEVAGLGFTLLDRVPELDYAVLTYLAVARQHRGQGIGGALTAEVVESFRGRQREAWLLVEAREPRLVALYAARGFRALDLDYRVPAFDGAGEQPMTLLAQGLEGVPEPDAEALAAMVRHMFVTGYGVAQGDPRLQAQLARIRARRAAAPTSDPC